MHYEKSITELLEIYPLEELFEVLEIEPLRVLEILLEGGHIILPSFVNSPEFVR